MSNKFNLFLLHEEQDIHPRSWICLRGEELSPIVADLEKENLRKFKITREELSRRMGKGLGCSNCVIKRVLQEKKHYPIAIIRELLSYSRHKNRVIKKINSESEWIKINGGSAKPVKACKKLTTDLAKILGAFMADGSFRVTIVFSAKENKKLNTIRNKIKDKGIKYSEGYSKTRKEFYIVMAQNRSNYGMLNILCKENSRELFIQTHHFIELLDFYKTNLEKFNDWVFSSFGLRPLKFYKRGNAWRTYFCSKILSRYFTVFFGVKPGKKTDIAFEPEIIENSSLKIRKAFAKGVLMFDGCATMNGRIQLESISPRLIKSIADIWSKDRIKFGTNGTVIYSLQKNTSNKLKEYFEKGTPKYDRLSMVYGRNLKYELDSNSKTISLAKMFSTIKTVKTCDINFIVKKFNVNRNTAIIYLRVLERNGKIRLDPQPDLLDAQFVSRNTRLLLREDIRKKLFERSKKRFGYYKHVALFLGIERGTFSAWKVGKNRIPIKVIEKMAKITNTNIGELYENIISTDRMICSLP